MWDQVLSQIDHSMTPQEAVLCWGGQPETLELVSSGINLVYRFQCGNETCYLKITHSELRPFAKLEAALAFQQYLQKCEVPVCPLVMSTRGQMIESIQQEEHVFLAHVVLAVPGSVMHFNYDKALYKRWGTALGQMHGAARTSPIGAYQYGQWENDIDELTGYANSEDRVIRKELATVLEYLKAHPKTEGNYGLIHGDHRKGNVLTNGSAVHFIDFDLPRFCWFMDDITRPFFSSIMQNHQNWQDKLLPYLQGYGAVCPVSQEDLHTFSWFVRYKALNMYLWTKHNWKSDIAPGGASTQTWLSQMYERIDNQSWIKPLDKVIAQVGEAL